MDLASKMKRLEAHSRANYHAERIYAELLYLYHLNRARALGWDEALSHAVDYLSESVAANGAIVKEDCENIELALSGMNEEAKKILVHCVAHAHIDMNWKWGYQETVTIATETFRTMLTLMNEYPGFTFSQSQAAVYEIVEKFEPELLREIRRRVAEGRWELSASTWVEGDKNMVNGESLCRHISYTKDYLSRLFGIDPDTLNLDFEPDTFGHNENLPDLLQNGGVHYFYHCRGCQPRGPYIWEAPSGRQVIAYSEPDWYQNGRGVDYREFSYIPRFGIDMGDGSMNEFLKVYGVGDHGGGPTRMDLEKITDMMSWPLFPTLRFSHYRDYYAYLETKRATLPVFRGELNSVFTGCYTSQSRIKLANRFSELRLYDAEALCATSQALTGKAPATDLTRAWTNTLFNQFHDILPGSGTIETREAALGLFQETLGYTNTTSTQALRMIADCIDTSALPYDYRAMARSEGAGAGYTGDRERRFNISCAERGRGSIRIFHLFNTTPYERDEALPIQMWDYVDDLQNLTAEDENGVTLPLQLQDGNRGYWGNAYATVLVRATVPPMGYRTVIIRQKDSIDPRRLDPVGRPDRRQDTFGDGPMVLENEYLRATFDAERCTLISLLDKESGEELVHADANAGEFRIVHENPRFGHSAWTRGPVELTEYPNRAGRVHVSNYQRQSLRHFFTYEMSVGERSRVSVAVILRAGSRTLDFDVHADWLEVGNNQSSPLLTFAVPVAYATDHYRYEIANGTVIRPDLPYDVPALCRMELLAGNAEQSAHVQLMADTKYGFRGDRGLGEIALIQSSFDPDPYPEMGQHHFHTAICVVHDGAEARAQSECYAHEIIAFSGTPHEGTLPLSDSAFRLEDTDGIALGGAHVSADGALILRLFNETDAAKVARLHFPAEVLSAALTDLTEVRDEPLEFTDKTVEASIGARATVTLKIALRH